MIAYNVCPEVLSQLGENIPETLSSDETIAMTEATLGLVKGITDEDLLGMKEMDLKLATSISFYSLMWRAAYYAKQEMVPFITCRVVQQTMEKTSLNPSQRLSHYRQPKGRQMPLLGPQGPYIPLKYKRGEMAGN
jgi:hypothetical protein